MADNPDSSDSRKAPNPWDRDPWKNEDPWKEDKAAWKEDDWGKPATPRKRGGRRGEEKGGLASYNKGMVEAGPYLTVGIQIAGAMLLFVGLGYAVDRWLETTPWGIIGGAMLGMVGVFTLVWRMAKSANEDLRAKQSGRAKGE